jgi:competence protein ComEC
VRTGDRFAVGDVSVRVLHPPQPDWERVKVRNDDSVALWVRYRDVGILLPGDAGTDVEGAWVSQIAAQPLVVLRAGHHGSRSSTGARLVRHIRPRLLVTSSGRSNRFGHPPGDVIRRAAQAGADIWRTDVDGAVQVATNGHVLVVRSASGRVNVVTGR